MPSQIHLYRPQRSRPEDLEAIFVGRESIIEDILEQLKRWTLGASRQHYLLIGPRGIGKTCLLTLVKHRIAESPELSESWQPLSIAEDAYGITSVADLLVEGLRLLAEQTGDLDTIRLHDKVRFDEDSVRVVDRVLDEMRRFHKVHNRGIVLMVENLNRLVERQIRNKLEIHLLRKILIEEEWLVTICTSPTFLNSVTQPEQPLFEFFLVKFLTEFTPEEQVLMLKKRAALDGNRAMEGYLGKFRSRLKALYHFTGGNPRLTVMLYDLVANQRIADMASELDVLLDQLTPFYQDRMKEIPEQEGKLLEAMALMPEGCSPTELAKEVRMPPKLVRALLTRLDRSGYVRPETRRQKRTVYIIPERFFRIWHQMNHSRAARGRIQYLLEFFESWYATKDERNQVWNDLSAQFQLGLRDGDFDRVEDVTEYMKYVVDVSRGGERFEREFDRLRQAARLSGPKAVETELKSLDSIYGQETDYFIHKGYFLANELGMHEAAVRAFQAAIKLKRDDIVALFNEAVGLDKLGRKSEAQKIYNQTAIFLSRRKGKVGIREAQQALIHIMREEKDSALVRIAAYVVGRTGESSIAESLIALLRSSSESWRRRHCATALGLLGSKAAESTLIHYLTDEFHDVRGSAATALGRIGSSHAVAPLVLLLSDTAPITRASAATALGRIGCKGAIQHVSFRLSDSDPRVRSSAATALGKLGATTAVGELLPLLTDADGRTRASAAGALGRIGDRRAASNLILLLEDGDSQVRGSAALALGRIGAEEAMHSLLELAESETHSTLSQVVTALGELRASEAVEVFVDLLESDVASVRASSAKALGQIRAEVAVPRLILLLLDEDVRVRGSAATSLGRIGSQAAVEPLVSRLWDADVFPRSCAAAALGRIGSQAAVQPLIECLTDKAEEVRASAAVSLGYLGAKEAIKPLTVLLLEDKAAPRRSAATALVRIAAEEPIPELLSVASVIIQHLQDRPKDQVAAVIHNLLRAGFGTGNLDVVDNVLRLISAQHLLAEVALRPYMIAHDYLLSSKDPSILERQHQEMREAVELIVSMFDVGIVKSR
jgi:HEAT repeat protein